MNGFIPAFRASGQWISPIEVENALIEHDAVLEAAVVPYQEAKGPHCTKAFVVLKQRITPYKYPRRIEFLNELPKSAAGRVLCYKLRESSKATLGSGSI